MIPKHIERKPGNDNYRALALYAADAKIHGETGEKTLMSWHGGCLAEDYLSGMIEVEATQAMNTRTTKEKTYHLMVSFRPEDESKLTPEVFKDIEKTLAAAIGFSEHQRHCGVHKNTDNVHMHIGYNMIDPVTFNRNAPYYDHQKLHKACRELEKKYGLAIDKGIDDSKEKPIKKHVKAETIEAQTGQQSFFNFAAGQKKTILEIVEKAGSWKQVHEALLKIGLEIKPKGNGLVVKDRFGKHAAKASDIDRSLSKSKMEKKLGSFIEVTPAQAAAINAETKYSAAPLHQEAQRDNLYAKFQAEMKQRKAALEAIKEQEGKIYKSNKSKWDEKRKSIEKYAMLPAHKRQLLESIKAREEAELANSRLTLTEQRKAIRESMPYTSWTKFLQHQAALGSEDALKVLRSKKVQPVIAIENSDEKTTTDLKAVKQSKEQRAAILSMRGITRKHKRALLTIVKMKEVMSKETDIKSIDIECKIDTKGTVIFTLKTGGSIRDTGTEIHFSSNESAAQFLAHKYAKIKWGREVFFENNIIKQLRTNRILIAR